MNIIQRFIWIILLFIFLNVAHAETILPTPITISSDDQTITLSGHMEMFLDKTNKLTINEVGQTDFLKNFVPYDYEKQTQRENFGMSTWLRFQVNNPFPYNVQKLLVRDLPNQYKGWVLYEKKNNTFIKIETLPKTYSYTLFKLDFPPKSTSTFYLYNYSEDWVQTSFFLKEPYVHVDDVHTQYFLFGLQYGIIVALLLHSILIYYVLRDKSYLIYIFFLFSALMAGVLKDGLLNLIPFIELSSWWYIHPFRLSIVMMGFFYVLFGKEVILTHKYVPFLNALIVRYLYVGIPLAFVAFIPSFENYIFANIIILTLALYPVIGIFLVFISSWFVIFKGYTPAKYYLGGMFFLFAGFSIFLLVNQRILHPNVFLIITPQLGLDIDMILQAIALAVRFNLIQESEIEIQKEVAYQKDLNVRIKTLALEKQKKLSKAYARFFPHRFLSILNKKSILDVHLGDKVEKNMAVLFADLRNFTGISEKKTPLETLNFINSFLSKIAPIIREKKGFVDKYVGDAILALFDEPKKAIDAANEMIRVLNSATHQQEIFEKIEMGIGIHFGFLMVGTIGEEKRMDGSVISDTVNIASRLENLNKIYGTNILITDTIEKILDKKEHFIRFVDHIYMKGKQVDIKIYEIFNTDPEELRTIKLRINPTYERALQLYREMDFKDALSLFNECDKQLPNDKVIKLYIGRCNKLAKTHLENNWAPVSTLSERIELT